MSNVDNWSDPPAEFALDGPFASGTRGWTRMPGHDPHWWTLRAVEPECGYTVEGGSFFDRAMLLVHWRFDTLTDATTRLTQRLELHGENAAAYVDGVRDGFEPNLEPGMRRLAKLMEEAARA
jgi:hypothetical protein